MIPLSAFYPYVLPFVPGCSNMLADQMIRDACIDFCANSLFVQEVLDPQSLYANVADYDFAIPKDREVAMVLLAWNCGTPMIINNIGSRQLRPEVFNTFFPGSSPRGSAKYLIQKDTRSFTVDGTPAENSELAITMVVATKPSRIATSVADLLFNEYATQIGQGAVARLTRMPKQPFTDMNASALASHDYMVARNEAQLRGAKSLGNGDSQVNFRRVV